MKIHIITVAPVPPEYTPAMTEHFKSVYGDILHRDTELTVQGLAAGPVPEPQNLPDYRNHYFSLLLQTEVVKAVLQAEAQGADAVVVNCYDDPGVKAARAVARVPVLGICEPSLHFACQLGREFGALVPDMPGQEAYLRWQVRDAGLWDRLLPNNGVRKESKPYIESQPESDANPEAMANRLCVQAEQLVRDGADVVLVACGGLGHVCDRVGRHHIEVDGRQVPMLTPLPVALKQAEAIVAMQSAYGIPFPSQVQDGFRLDAENKVRIQRGYGLEAS